MCSYSHYYTKTPSQLIILHAHKAGNKRHSNSSSRSHFTTSTIAIMQHDSKKKKSGVGIWCQVHQVVANSAAPDLSRKSK